MATNKTAAAAPKSPLKSKTILGALGTILVAVAPFVGLDFTSDDAMTIGEGIERAVLVATAALSIYGRFKVAGPLAILFKGKK